MAGNYDINDAAPSLANSKTSVEVVHQEEPAVGAEIFRTIGGGSFNFRLVCSAVCAGSDA